MIELHGGIKERNFYQEVVFFADKMDFTKNRLRDNYKEILGRVSKLESIDEITFEIVDDYFIVKITTDGTVSVEDLYVEREKYKKYLEYYVSSIASKRNLKYKIYWDEKIIFSGDKKIELNK